MRKQSDTPWTTERIVKLEELWIQGVSCSIIADALNNHNPEGPITRNAVIGKAHRLGLPARPSPFKK